MNGVHSVRRWSLIVLWVCLLSCCVDYFVNGSEVEYDALTNQYLTHHRSTGKVNRAAPFLHAHNHKCRPAHDGFMKLKTSPPSLIIPTSKKCSNCKNSFELDRQPGKPHGLTLVLYREAKFLPYIHWLVSMVFQLEVDIIDIQKDSPSTIDICKHSMKRPVVLTSHYSDVNIDATRFVVTLTGLQYTCSDNKLAKTYSSARISKLLMLVHDPLLLLWREYVMNHLPSVSSTAETTGMLGFDWARWDDHLSQTLQTKAKEILQAASQGFDVDLGVSLMNLPRSIVLPLRSDELLDRQEVDVHQFLDLYTFLTGANFTYEQVRYRREISPQEYGRFDEATSCLATTFPRKNATTVGVDHLVQRYIEAAFSFPGLSCQVQHLYSQNPFMKEFPSIVPRHLMCDGYRDIATPQSRVQQKVHSCQRRYLDRSYRDEVGNKLPVALVGGFDQALYDTRRLFEYATGQYTGALKGNGQMLSLFPAESYCGVHVAGIHATSFNAQPVWSPYDLELRFDPATLRRCRSDFLYKMTHAVLVMNDPFLFLWRRHFDPNGPMSLRQLVGDEMTPSSGQDPQTATLTHRRLRRGRAPPSPPTVTRKVPTTLEEIFVYWEETMQQESSTASVFGDGTHQYLHAPRSDIMPTRSMFPVSHERLLVDAQQIFHDDAYRPPAATATAAGVINSTDNALVELLRFSSLSPDDDVERFRCAFAHVEESTRTIVDEIAKAKAFYDAHPQVLCRVQSWVRNHTAPLHRRAKLLYPLVNVCGFVETKESFTTSLGKCREDYASRSYRDQVTSSPAALIAPKNTPDARVVRVLIEHATGLYTGSTETWSQYKGVFPADEYCGRRMAVIHSPADFLSFSQREDGEAYLRIESKGARSRCRRGLVTNFVESIVMMKDPFVLIFETLHPQLAANPATARAATIATPEEMFAMVQQPFTADWQAFNASLNKLRSPKSSAQLEAAESQLLQRLLEILSRHFAPKVVAVSNEAPQRHFLGSAVDEFIRSPYYETSNGQQFFFGSIEAIVDSTRRLSSVGDDVDVSQLVFQQREAFFALLHTARVTSYVPVARLKCGFAFINDETVALQQRLEVIRQFYRLYPRVLCQIRLWVGTIFAPHEDSVYALFDALPHGKNCEGKPLRKKKELLARTATTGLDEFAPRHQAIGRFSTRNIH